MFIFTPIIVQNFIQKYQKIPHHLYFLDLDIHCKTMSQNNVTKNFLLIFQNKMRYITQVI